MPTEIPVAIAGASVRAAAASALRAGLRPWCVDLFADLDLARACPTRIIELKRYPTDLPALLASGPSCPWIYTGALENRPDILAEVPRPLWGIPAEVVRKVRDPQRLARTLADAGLATPRVVTDAADIAGDRWLLKPRQSAAGIGVREFPPGEPFDPRTHYLQERIEGEPSSAVFLGRGDGSCAWIGTTRQLIGARWLHAPLPFLYCGSISAPPPSTALRGQLQSLGDLLVRAFGLRGLFGVDFVLRQEMAWPVEVNPRYTASVEILERATSRSLLRDHVACFAPGLTRPTTGKEGSTCWGKAILFATGDGVVPDHGPWCEALARPLADLDVAFADLPSAGQPLRRGQPVLTFFARGPTPEACEGELRKIAATLDRAFAVR